MIIIGGMQKHQAVKTDGICTTLCAAMGTGGGYVPMIVEKIKDVPKCINLYDDNGKETSFQDRVYKTKDAVSPAITTSFRPFYLVEVNENEKIDIRHANEIPRGSATRIRQCNFYTMCASKKRRETCFRSCRGGQMSNKLIYANYRKVDNASPEVERTLLARDCKGFGSSHETSNAVLVKQATKEGFIECKLPGIVDISYPESTTRRGRVQGGEKICPTLTTSPDNLALFLSQYRIRKLTVKECARFMSFTDEDAEAMQSVNSNGQCYKQCGNSIVTKVLEELFKSIM